MCARPSAPPWARMVDFVQAPNLPLDADIVIIGEKYADKLAKPIEKFGINPIFAPNNPKVDPRLTGHADLSVFHAGGERIYLAPYLRGSEFAKKLKALGADIIYADIAQSPIYPNDAQLNIAAIGSSLIFNPKSSYLPAVNYSTIEHGYQSISCKQGYAKCAALVVNERSLITQDPGIACTAIAAGLGVLQISPDGVALDGFFCGFIGGAGFKLNTGELAFTGTLDALPDKPRILAFLAERNITPVYLTDSPIFDIGSAIPLTEK